MEIRRTHTNSHHLQLKELGSTSQIENPSISISNPLRDHRLPQELIHEILLYLPVKSLSKFKCVSKAWLSLISCPQFIRSHFSKSKSNYLNYQLLFAIRDPVIHVCSLYSALREANPSTFVYDIEFPPQNPNVSLSIVGIVNGLVCIVINDTTNMVLWNPILKKIKYLPHSIFNLDTRFASAKIGLGYDESNDDYKVFSFLMIFSNGVFKYEVQVYSLRANSWNRLEDLTGFLLMSDKLTYANGKLYSPVRKLGDSNSIRNWKILSLDVASEKYRVVQLPDYKADWKLGVLDGRLLLLYDYMWRKRDVWVMDKFGVEESWCKFVSIEYDAFHFPNPYILQRVVCVLSDSEIVFENGHGLIVYNSKKKEWRDIEMDVGTSSYFQVALLVESLVSPNGW